MFRRLMTSLALTVLLGLPATAAELETPKGEVILTVSGNLVSTNQGDKAVLDLDMLKAMDAVTIETTTIWTEGTQTFVGVSLAEIVTHLGLGGSILRATAINDYAVDIPLTDATEGGAVVAYLLNGDTMSIRDKGPLWIVYPYDADAAFRTEVIYSRSIWQLDRLEAID